jgi:cytochrome P450
LANLDPIVQVWTEDPNPVYRELRENHPLHYVAERDLWVISRYADVQATLKDPETFSSREGVVPNGYVPEKPTVIVMDPPRHTRMRHVVNRAFTPRRIEALSARIREIAGELADALPAAGEVDAFHAFTDPLPLYVMAELLGVDRDQREMFKRCGDAIVYATDTPAEVLLSAQAELTDYLAEVFEWRRREPRDDLISVLLTASSEGDALSQDDLLGLCFLLLVAGTETTTSALGNAILLFDRYPEARESLLADPSRIQTAVEEVLRFDPPVHGLCRVLTRDVELYGQRIPRGARLHMLFAAANRDPRVFQAPDRFDVARTSNHHFSFGFGVHFCLGASLARMELRVGLEEFLRRSPGYRVQHAGVQRLRSDTNRGFSKLPIRS